MSRVLVTGAASGLGEALTRAFRERGDDVLATDVAAIDEVVRLDITSDDDWAAVLAWVEERWGRLDVLVNNAGIWDGAWFDELPLEQFRTMVDTHYLGTVNTAKAAWPHLKQAEKGCIVNTSSEAVIGMVPKNPDYAALEKRIKKAQAQAKGPQRKKGPIILRGGR